MVDKENAKMVVSVLAENLRGVALSEKNFERLPDTFWGYYARGHDAQGAFGVVVVYSEAEGDVDGILQTYQKWFAAHLQDAHPDSP